ncbi:hypothetical protein Pam4_58 [Pseudanabaena phage Pam4]|nr:hypothetical protein Pam4_58 [Pseudanabaena phage Pam4]
MTKTTRPPADTVPDPEVALLVEDPDGEKQEGPQECLDQIEGPA